MHNIPSPVVDPYALVRVALDLLGEHDYTGPIRTEQLGEAGTMAAGLLAALGATPAVDNDPNHPRCQQGLTLLGVLRAHGGQSRGDTG